MTELQKQLDQNVPVDCISKRGKLSYISHRYVKATLNRLFGWDGWSYEVLDSKLLSIDDETVRWYSHVRVSVATKGGPFPTSIDREGIAIGHGTLKNKDGQPFTPGRQNEIVDFAAAESVTDALKRATVSYGDVLGLCLYPWTDEKTLKTPESQRTNLEKIEEAIEKMPVPTILPPVENPTPGTVVVSKAEPPKPKRVTKAMKVTALGERLDGATDTNELPVIVTAIKELTLTHPQRQELTIKYEEAIKRLEG